MRSVGRDGCERGVIVGVVREGVLGILAWGLGNLRIKLL